MIFDLISVAVGGNKNRFVFSLRVYDELGFGKRKLGPGRYAFDCSYISFVFERYSQ